MKGFSSGLLAGTVTVASQSSLNDFGLRGRFNVCCENYECGDPCNSCFIGSSRVDLLVGYRYMRLRDDLLIRENLRDLDPPGNLQSIREIIFDSFSTRNEFNGLELGIAWETHRRRWYCELLGKLELPDDVFLPPVVAADTILFLTEDAELIAYR